MSNRPLNTDLVDKAIVFATNAHHGTERRCKGFPYIVHPLEAMAIVATMTPDPELLAAAVLHDTVEDTDVTLEQISREFGERIAWLVSSETDVKTGTNGEKLPWKERKQRDMDALRNAPREVKMVAMGDKLSNMRAIARDYKTNGDAIWQIFREKDKATHAWRFHGLCDAFSEIADTFAYREFAWLVELVFGKKSEERRVKNSTAKAKE